MKDIKIGTTHSVILENIKNIYRKISSAAIRSGRNPFDIKLIAVTKTVDIEMIKEAVSFGLRALGESRVQEAQKKIADCRAQCADCDIEWHMIGHLQQNKAKVAVELFELIQSLDSIELAKELNKHSEKAGKIQRVLIEVKLSEEESKYGVAEKSLMDLIKVVAEMKNLKLLDISSRSGNPVMATADGIGSFSGWNGGNGNLVVLEHGFGFSTFYAHNSMNAVKVGQKVKRGDVISHVGSTGSSTGPHVHY